MDKYTVLLVDDEEEVVQVISKKINWEELGFSVIGYANNGIKALEMMEEFQADVVMTDIKMPYMDGMELTNRIKTEFPATKILIFTGFDEFEYAKEAVHLKVEEYILKPLNSVELKKVFHNLKLRMDQEISEKRNAQILQKYYLDSLPLLQANFYSTLIEGRLGKNEIEKYIKNYQISLKGPYFCCLDIHTSSRSVPENMTHLLLSTSVQRQAKERLGEKYQAKIFSYLGDTILIVRLDNENEISELTDECDRFCRYAKRIIGAVVTVGVGQICSDIIDLSRSYSSAREAVSYRAIYGASRAINIKEIAPKEMGRSGSANDEQLGNLFKAIRLRPVEDIIDEVNKYFENISFQKKSLQHHYIDIMELVSAFYRFAVNNNIEAEDFSGDIRKLYENLLELEPEALKKWVLDISFSYQRKLTAARSMSTQSFVFEAKAYVRDNYSNEELSLDNICAFLGISNSYFSTIFKKATGNSFIGYLTDYRMDQAARLLIETREKSYIIAKSVGYSDPNYFSYVFKRRFGVSPSNYRTEHAKE